MSQTSEYKSDPANKMSPYAFPIPTASGWDGKLSFKQPFTLPLETWWPNPIAYCKQPWTPLFLNHTWALPVANWHKSKAGALVQLVTKDINPPDDSKL